MSLLTANHSELLANVLALARSIGLDQAPSAAVVPERYVSIKLAAATRGLEEGCIRKRIARATWIEGVHYKRDPDGRIWIDNRGVDRWIEGKTRP